ncbi:MAG: hypothetical protein C4321_06520, partial [Chloroflexota bacterium]
MRLAWGPEEEAFRAELDAFLDEHAPPEALAGRDWEGEGEDLIPAWRAPGRPPSSTTAGWSPP